MSVSRIEVMINAQKSEAALFAASYVIATTCEYIGTKFDVKHSKLLQHTKITQNKKAFQYL